MTPPASLGQRFRLLSGDAGFREILRGSAWALGGQVLGTALGLLTSIVVARYYGAEVMGVVALLNSILGLATILALLGCDGALLRLLPEHLVNHSTASAALVYRKTLGLVFWASLGIGILFLAAAELMATRLFAKPQLTLYLSLSAIFLICSAPAALITQAVRGMRLGRLYGMLLVLPPLANLLLLLPLTWLHFRPGNPVYVMLTSLVVTGFFGWNIMERTFRKLDTPSGSVVTLTRRDIFALSLPMLTTTVLFYLTSQSGLVIMGIFQSEREVGYYSVAVKLSTLVGFILNAVNAMAAPKFSELFHSGRIDELFYIAKKSAKLIFWITTPLMLVLAILGKPLLALLFGAEFTAAYPALLLLLAGQFVNAVSGSTWLFMNMTGQERALRNIVAGTAVLNVGLGLALIPKLGSMGAAIAAMLGLSLLNVLILIFIKRKYGRTTGYLPLPGDRCRTTTRP